MINDADRRSAQAFEDNGYDTVEMANGIHVGAPKDKARIILCHGRAMVKNRGIEGPIPVDQGALSVLEEHNIPSLYNIK